MSNSAAHNPESVLRDGKAIDRAIVAAHRQVILRHRQLKAPLAIWRNGQVIEVPPESVDLPPGDERHQTDSRATDRKTP